MAAKHADVAIKLDGKKFKAGDSVTGTIEPGSGDSGRLEIVLAYVDRSPSFINWTAHDRAEVDADAGAFELQLPPAALPSFNGEKGSVGWELLAGKKIKPGSDGFAMQPLDVTPSTGLEEVLPSSGLERGRFGNIRPAVKITGPQSGPRKWVSDAGFFGKFSANHQWDAPFEIDKGALHRGESVTATISLEEPSETRHPIEVGIRCVEHFMFERVTSDDDGPGNMMTFTGSEIAHEEWVDFDPSIADHTEKLTIPKSAPFSYAGESVYYEWKLGVCRPHPGGRKGPPERWLPLWVFP